jgi:ribosomal protein S18 acetylase RimI-like enzyme
VAAKAESVTIVLPEPVEIRTLTPDDVQELRLGWRTRLSPEEIQQILRIYPGRSVWSPETLEYAIAAPWRHREEVANIQELSAVRHADQLVAALVERAQLANAALVLSIELDETRRPKFYEGIGFSLIEEVITFELLQTSPRLDATSHLDFQRANVSDVQMLELLCEIDNSSFPWLWWNSRIEFETYALTPGVEIYIGYFGQDAVSYIGITSYGGWGHLDRIAVIPNHQHEGFGLESLDFAVRTLVRQGARRIGLSTQRLNLRSQKLYERFGFHRSETNDYHLYGKYLVDPSSLEINSTDRT